MIQGLVPRYATRISVALQYSVIPPELEALEQESAMPEAPEMEVVKDFLAQNLMGQEVTEARVLKPSVLRSLQGDVRTDIVGRAFIESTRRGKFLILSLSGDRAIVINPKLTGGLQFCPSKQRILKRTCILLALSGGFHLRYTDDRQMGVFYYVSHDQLGDVPGLDEQGPDVLDNIDLEEFQSRLKGFHGEIKGILTRGKVLSGIGNAYADEILFDAKVYPFKRRKQLSSDELRRIHHSARRIIVDATSVVRERMNGQLDHKLRDFLAVHNKGGPDCPDCGNKISQITANRRITSYCRRCQPGMLIKN